MPSALHDIAVQRILEIYPGSRASGLYSALRKATGDDSIKTFGVVPDAYVVDAEREFVIVFEVENSHPVRSRKMERYGDLYWTLSGLGWEIGLITTDKWGNRTATVDIGMYEFERLRREAKQRMRQYPLPKHLPATSAWFARFAGSNG